MQTNWIGRSTGAEIVFETAPSPHHAGGKELRVFTTRPDTLYGATFMVLAPEHPLVAELTAPDRKADVEAYVKAAADKTEIDRLSDRPREDGRPDRRRRDQPGQRRADPDLHRRLRAGRATAPARSWPSPPTTSATSRSRRSSACRSCADHRAGADPDEPLTEAFVDKAADEAPRGRAPRRPARRHRADQHGQGRARELACQLRAVGRQAGDRRVARHRRGPGGARAGPARRHLPPARLAGQPPALLGHARSRSSTARRDGIVPVPESELPVLLPDNVDYHGSGENPLNRDEAFLNVTCPSAAARRKRETDTMDTFIDSSWYWFRYLSPHKADGPVDDEWSRRWTPVDQYTGGAEHAVMHLLYSRFFTKAMRDLGLVHDSEPFQRLFNQGQILGADGERMSQVPRQRPGPGRAGRPLRRRRRPAVPDVHGPVGPGRPVEPHGIGGVPSSSPASGRSRSTRRVASSATRRRARCPRARTRLRPATASAPPRTGRCGT